MTPAQVIKARKRLGLTQSELAAALRMGEHGRRQVRRWEQGDSPVSGPASVAIELLLSRSEAQERVKPLAEKEKAVD